MRLWVAFAALLAFAAPAHARWYKASSENFVIYADDNEKDVREFAENLEKFHAAMAFVTGRKVPPPSPSNRVVIFAVGNERDLQKLAGTDNRSLAGFYVPRAGASRAFVQDIRTKRGYPSFSTVVLLHEYAHHFLISSSRFGMPRWLSEGAAEFFASASFNKDGTVQVGRPAQHRAGELTYALEVTVEQLLDPEYENESGRHSDAFYGRSWALFHYLTFNEERSGQLAQYWKKVAEGTSSLDAGREVFGDLDELEDELEDYLRQRRMLNFVLKPEWITFGPIALRELPAGEAEMMNVRMKSQRGVDEQEAIELLVDARAIAARFPDDPGVLTALAEAEFDAGNDDAAIAAADRAILLDPARKNAYVQKGYALFRKAEDAEDVAGAYKAAMVPFQELNKLENDHPVPLIYYFRSFVDRGMAPNETARHAMERASVLAPFDHGLAMNVAMMHAREGKIELARHGLRPLASNPHGGQLASIAKSYMDELESVEEGTEWTPQPTMGMPAIEDLDAGAGADGEAG